MTKLLKKVLSLALAFAVMLSCVPLSALAACSHTPDTDVDGNVIWYADPEEHYFDCTICQTSVFSPHADADSDGNCDDCGAAVVFDSTANMYIHSHIRGNVTPKDADQHYSTCTDCGRIYEQTAHEDTDNDDKCDKCFATLDANDIHIHQPDNNWTEDGPNEHCCECTECEGWVYEPHDDVDGNGKCDGCNKELQCQHTGLLWYATDVETHRLHCGECGQSVTAIENHNDTDNEGKCDVCKVEVTGNIHTHVWDTNWTSTGSTAHFHNCTDTNCTTSTDSIAHVDNDSDGACDDCGNTELSDWCRQHYHNGAYITAGSKHYQVCGNCLNGFGSAENHSNPGDYVSDGEIHRAVCGDCGAEFDPQPHSGTTAYDTDDGFHRAICEFCGEIYGDAESHHGVNGFESDRWTHRPVCLVCGVAYGQPTDHEDDDMDGICHICGNTVPHEESSEYVPYNDGHAKYCTHCDKIIPSTVQPHNPDLRFLQALEDGHINICMDCGAHIMSSKVPHTDTDGDMYCDGCDTTVDSNCIHHHEYEDWTCEEIEHVKYCAECGMADAAVSAPHEDTDSDGRCDVCNAKLDSDKKHIHTEVYTYGNNTVHWISCTGCDKHIGGMEHIDTNSDRICEFCESLFIDLDITASTTDLAEYKADVAAAVEKAAQGDASALKALIVTEDNMIANIVNAYNQGIAAGEEPIINVYISVETILKTELDEDPDAKAFADKMEAFVSGGKIEFAFTVTPWTELVLGGRVVMIPMHEDAAAALSYTLALDQSFIASDRTWHVLASEDLGDTIKKVTESEKGASTVNFTTDSKDNVFAFVYTTGDPAPTPTPSAPQPPAVPEVPAATPAPTVKPTAKPSPAVKPTATPAPTEEPVEMPKEADTTIVGITAKEEVVEAAKETVTVTEGVATVDKAAVEAIVEASAEETTVVIPLAQITEETVNKAEINTEALAAIAKAQKDVVIELTDVTIKLDTKAIQAITEQADGETVEIRAVKVDISSLTASQQKKIKEMDTAVVVSVQIFSDGEYIGKFKGGKATVMLPFEIEDGKDAKDYRVYYIDEKGNLKKVASEYVNGYMVFTTALFSDYVIVYEGTQLSDKTDVAAPQEPAENVSFPVLPIIIAVIAVMVIIIIIKKKKETEE